MSLLICPSHGNPGSSLSVLPSNACSYNKIHSLPINHPEWLQLCGILGAVQGFFFPFHLASLKGKYSKQFPKYSSCFLSEKAQIIPRICSWYQCLHKLTPSSSTKLLLVLGIMEPGLQLTNQERGICSYHRSLACLQFLLTRHREHLC